MTSDSGTPIQDLKDRVTRFAEERDWGQFHSPKNLSMALAVEAAELLELFQWKTEQETIGTPEDSGALRRVREELADVAIYLLNLCNRLNIDLAKSVVEKLAQNARKYPVDIVKGKSLKYSDIAARSKKQELSNAASWSQLELVLEDDEDDGESESQRDSSMSSTETPLYESFPL